MRVRTTAAAVLVVGVALMMASVAMVVLLRRSLTSDVEAAALLRAEAVADGIAAGDPDPAISGGDEEFVQVVDADGRVVAASENLSGEPPVADLRPGESETLEDLPFEDDPFLAVAVPGSGSDGPVAVMAGRSLDEVEESSRAVAGLLAAGVPLLLVVVGFIEWRVVGRALRPVEAIRSEVDAISTQELHRRVPDPGGADEIARLAATMNRMLTRLEGGQARQRRFVSDASHELRSPVTTIRQHAEVALSHPGEIRVEDLAEVVLEEDLRLQHLVDDLLLLARLDEGSPPPSRRAVDLDDLLFEEAERGRGTGLRVDVGAVSAGRVSGDPVQLAKLVRNMADNAIRHADSAISFSLVDDGDEVVLAIEDDGNGIPAAERERIFERFVRLDDARDRDSGGSGLGLAIVAEVAQAHGASVSVDRGELGGARFEVRFAAAD